MLKESIRNDFPFLSKHPRTAYFDNACTTLKPASVLDAERSFYEDIAGCAGRSSHAFSKAADAAFEDSRKAIARFCGAKSEELAFTKNATEALNLAVQSLAPAKGENAVTTVMEHHSALLPALALTNEGVEVRVAKPSAQGVFSAEHVSSLIDRKTRLVVVHAANNSLGTRAPLREIVKAAHDAGARVVVDGAQSVPHAKTDFGKIGADALAFSGHKMLGPTGIGCLLWKNDAMERAPNFLVGGGTVETVSLDAIAWRKGHSRFEAGIQHYAGAIGLAAACNYLAALGMENADAHEQELAQRIAEEIRSLPGVDVYGPSSYANRCGIVTFNIANATPHEVALMLDAKGFAVRSGVFCAEPALAFLGAEKGAVRASLYAYNTKEEAERFVSEVKSIARVFS